MSPPSWSDDKKLVNISLLVGFLGTAFVPLGLFQLPEFAEFCVGPRSHADIQALQELRIAPWWKDDTAEFTLQDGIHYARASSKAYKWAGYYVRVPARDYTVELDARLIGPLARDPSPGQGWGYGVGLCSFLRSPEPQGLSWQYDVYQSSTGRWRPCTHGFFLKLIRRARTKEMSAVSPLSMASGITGR